jgi:hypothetical protein
VHSRHCPYTFLALELKQPAPSNQCMVPASLPLPLLVLAASCAHALRLSKPSMGGMRATRPQTPATCHSSSWRRGSAARTPQSCSTRPCRHGTDAAGLRSCLESVLSAKGWEQLATGSHSAAGCLSPHLQPPSLHPSIPVAPALQARSHGFLNTHQEEPYGDITLTRGPHL